MQEIESYNEKYYITYIKNIMQDETHKLNLLLLTNNKMSQIGMNNKSNNIFLSREYKLYKKRVFQLIKDIFNRKNENENLKDSLGLFINDAIEYIKFKDKADYYQEEYKDLNDINLNDKDLEEQIDDNFISIDLSNNLLETIPEETNKLLYNNGTNSETNDIRNYLGITSNVKKDIIINLPKQRIVKKMCK